MTDSKPKPLISQQMANVRTDNEIRVNLPQALKQSGAALTL